MIIFDSRNAADVYRNYSYYRSSSFTVQPGEIALIELTANQCVMKCVCFQALRTPDEVECYKDGSSKFDKIYRRNRCNEGIGVPWEQNGGRPTLYTQYNKSVVRWGYDVLNKTYVEFEYITRPGNYYLMASKCNGDCLDDCENPVFLEVSMIPTPRIPDLPVAIC